MTENLVKRKLATGDVALGTMVFEFPTTGMARIVAAAGAEFAIFDQEHTGFSLETLKTFTATARACEMVPLVRVPAVGYHLIAGALDAGPLGVMVPMVESSEQAVEIVAAAKYPPLGRRGVGLVYRDELIEGSVSKSMERLNAELLVILQIETVAGLESAGDIAAVEGVDALWLGQFDLTASLGIPGEFDHPTYVKAVDELLAICGQVNKPLGLMAATVEEGTWAIERGFRAVAYGGDLWLYQAALRDGLDRLDEVRQRSLQRARPRNDDGSPPR